MYFDERDMNYTSEINDILLNDIDTKKYDIDNVNIFNINRESSELFDNKEGFNKGNLFKNEYNPYKKYIYKIEVSGDKDKLLLTIQELTFKLIDLGLYLDLYNDKKIFDEFRETALKLKEYRGKYEKEYGPLSLKHAAKFESYLWNKDPWPWMNKGGNL